MQRIEHLFFQLLQVAIGTRKTLDRLPTSEEWALLFDMSKKQALTAVAFTGVTRLNEASDFGASLGIPEVVYLKWLGLTAKVAQRNKEVSAACVELVKQYAHDGLSTCILKGQSNLINYPEELKECRTPGDIDIWVKPADPCGLDIAVADLDGRGAHYERYTGKRAVIEYVTMLWRLEDSKFAQKGSFDSAQDRRSPLCKNHEPEVRYHHIDAPAVNGVEVEAHFRPLFLDSPLRNWRLQRWFKENEQFETLSTSTSSAQAKSPCLGREPSLNGSNSSCAPVGAQVLRQAQYKLSKLGASGSNIPLYFDNAQHKIRGTFANGTKVEGGFPVPTVSFNAVYQLCHIYRHLFDEGIGLRQLLDYYFVLRALHIEQGELADRTQSMAQWAEGMGVAVKSNEEIMHTLSRFGMRKFASATMYVLQTVFEAPLNSPEGGKLENTNWQTKYPWMICEPNEKEGKFLLNEIMQAGNFGKYETRISHETPSIPLLRGKKVPQQLWHAWEKLKHNMRLVRHYPEEVLCEPFFRLYHWLWRKLELWRY